ncbi:hypothetical protein BH11MYX1_BH11MYX1_20090 [soil metagenome]
MSEIYRDRSEGTAARRQELLRRRSDELVTMPHAVRGVVVGRTARITASMVATVGGIALIATAFSPHLAEQLASVMPGIQPAPLSTLLAGSWLVGLVAWAVSRARVEHRFAVAMSKYVLPSNDVDLDVERLDHEHPDHIARTMGQDLEVRSAAWPILAAGVLLPATALWIARGVRTHGWPVMSEFEQSLALHAKPLMMIGIGGAVGAIVMTRKAARLPVIATMLIPVGAVAGIATIFGFANRDAWAWPMSGVAVLAMGIGVIARTLRNERALLEVEDPAAGSELFTIRGVLRELRSGMVAAKTQVMRLSPRTRWAAVSLVAISAGSFGVMHARHKAAGSITAPVFAQQPLRPSIQPDFPTDLPYSVLRNGDRFEVNATIEGNDLVVPMIGFAELPLSWSASLDVQIGAGEASVSVGSETAVSITPGSQKHRFSIDACRGNQPLALHLFRTGTTTAHVKLFVVPTLTVAHCE